jgi:hypothetical protein
LRILLDENVPTPLKLALRSFLLAHEIVHVTDLKWSGTTDLDLYRMAGVHRVQYPHRHSGITGLGIAIGTVCAGLPLALNAVENAGSQLLIRIVGLDPTPGSRLKVTDPAQDPPKFWPGHTGPDPTSQR